MSNGLLNSREEYLLANFERALEEEWIEIYLQPVIRASNGCICEEEVFSRWDDPVLGVLNPDDFIPVLEKHGKVERLDLYMLDRALDKIKKQEKLKMGNVTTSINFSLLDFQKRDIVKKIDDKVAASGVSKSRVAFELSESSVLVENQEAIDQLEKLQALGYRLELDDFGYNCIPLLLSSAIHFDTLKLNMALTRHVANSKEAAIIVEELLKIAMKLGIDVIAKGVERKEQVDFLSEIGCSKFQGFFYSKPIKAVDLFDNVKKKKLTLNVEDAREEEYYSKVDKINIQELSLNKVKQEKFKKYRKTIPIAILELDEDSIRAIRINSDCVQFFEDNFPGKKGSFKAAFISKAEDSELYVLSAIKHCVTSEEPIVIDDKIPTGKIAHIMLQRIAQNPVNDRWAVLFAVIAVDDQSKRLDALSYTYIAQALSENYVAMYYIDIDTNSYVEYHVGGKDRGITIENSGDDFFYDAHNDVEHKTYHEDLDLFNRLCTKENILKAIEEKGVFSIIYRASDEFGVRYVNFKAVLDRSDDKHIIVGVNSVDDQIKQQQAYKSLQEERNIISRVAALAGNFFAVYSIDLDDNSYNVYKTEKVEGYIGNKVSGKDFFAETNERIVDIIHPDDIKGFKKNIRKNNILKVIAENGFFEYRYRLIIDEKPLFFMFKAVIVTENDESKLVVGLIDINAQTQKDKEYAENLSAAEDMAFKDELTGVKNKHAYAAAEEEMQKALEAGTIKEFAIVVFDLNDLKYVNDNFGHKKGDEFIKAGCRIICETFAHSPVYRIGGDEFVVIAHGKDYDRIDYLMGVIETRNNENLRSGDVTMAAGMARSKKKSSISSVFEKADTSMYEKKSKMKEMQGSSK